MSSTTLTVDTEWNSNGKRWNGFEIIAFNAINDLRFERDAKAIRRATVSVADAMAHPHADNDRKAVRVKLAETVWLLVSALGERGDNRRRTLRLAPDYFRAAYQA